MPSIQFGGLSSGLDTKSIIAALIDVERQPLLRLQAAQATLTARKAAYDGLGTALRDLLAKAQAFTVTSAGSARLATFADPTRLTAVAATSAVPGQYTLSVDRLATATKATSTAAVGTAITDATAVGTMSSLPLAGTVTAGKVGLVVDGKIVSATIGAPDTTSLKTAIDAIAAAVQAQVQVTDAGATVTASIVGNRLQLAISGAAGAHDVRFGVAGDTSNALTLFGLAGQHVANFGTGATTITGTALLGVAQVGVPLDSAGLTGLTSTTSGVLTINGVAIAYDTTTESLSTILTRINNSNAGVVASVDRTNDRIVLSRKNAGAVAIDIRDTSGTLADALKLAPGTTNAQVIGQTAQVTVDGRIVTSDTNTVTNAIDGVTLTLLAQSTAPSTLTVGVDGSAIQRALTDFVNSYNSLADKIDQLTRHAQGAPAAPLEGEATVPGLGLALRSLIMTASPTLTTGAYRSLGDLGVTFGPVGAKVGTTTRLSLDTAKLSDALAADPTRVAMLLGAGGGILQPIVDRLKSLTGTNGLVDAATTGIADALRLNGQAQTDAQARIDLKRQELERKFAALEATLARLQSQSAQVGAQVSALSSNSGR